MGNCLRNNKISAQDHENYQTPIEAPWREQSMEKKVRFKIQNDVNEGDGGCHGNVRSGTVRIRLVMTQEELKRMLSCKDVAQNTSLEQLLGAVKLRGGKFSEEYVLNSTSMK
ncbi:hypothetical protein VNO77_36798 [Canavalia gladiata]|uniref:Uncharacterized protein n=1 Tax=Canavalia gladiata TaxID=3824 RepID=A0AAN9KBG9_CANGL